MNDVIEELKRLAINASARREDLLLVGLNKARTKKTLSLLSGALALFSAGSITAVITKVFGSDALQIAAAVTAALSGIISLFIQIYFRDEDVVSIFTGSASYLSLRDNVYRTIVNPNLKDSARYKALSDLQSKYAELDRTYSRYFSQKHALSHRPSPYLRFYIRPSRVIISKDAIEKEKERFIDKLEQSALGDKMSSDESGT